MQELSAMKKKDKIAFIVALIILLVTAFIQCYNISHDLNWPCDVDIFRDMSYAQGNLYGDFGKDPNFVGAYLWYNPLLTLAEAGVAKISGLPLHVVLIRSGAYLNLLSPIAFIFMMVVITDYKVALAALLSYLFFALGQNISPHGATYAPWLFPVCFAQFFFYLNIILCYKAFRSQKYFWFFVLGFFIGFSFLAHSEPAILIILVMAFMQLPKVINAIKEKDFIAIKKYLLQGLITFVPFAIASLPLTYFIIGKYHMHFLNRTGFEYAENMFIVHNFLDLIKNNVSVSFVIAVIGFIWFYKNFHNPLIRKIIFGWLWGATIMFVYSTAVRTMDDQFNIKLPGTVPSSDFFYYLKALQSVFFGFGFAFLISPLLTWVNKLISNQNEATAKNYINSLFIASVLLCAIIYFPFYKNRYDFVHHRNQSIINENKKDDIGVYNYIMQNIPRDKVILCEDTTSIFPVMPTARKMVSIIGTFSNPYLSYFDKARDRLLLLSYLKKSQPLSAEELKLFDDYQVSYILLRKDSLTRDETYSSMFLKNPVFATHMKGQYIRHKKSKIGFLQPRKS